MSGQEKIMLPSRGARVCAAVLALLMTICLFVALAGMLGLQVMTSEGLHERVALSGDAVDQQMSRIQQEITSLAEEYGFQPETLLSLISREQVEQFDREVVRWWTGAAATGTLAEEPYFDLDGTMDAMLADTGFVEKQNPMQVRITIGGIRDQAEEKIRKSAVMFREMLLQLGIRFAGEQVNLPQMAELLRRVPPAAGLAALLLAGLIALVLSRRVQIAGQYIGGALSAAGLLTILGWGLIRLLRIRQMIGEASSALEAQYAHLARIMTAEILGVAALLMILGGLGMALARREYGRHGA